MKYFNGSVIFSIDDLKIITKTINAIWNQSFKLNKDFLIRNEIESYRQLPFGFKDDRADLFCKLKKDQTVTFDMNDVYFI